MSSEQSEAAACYSGGVQWSPLSPFPSMSSLQFSMDQVHRARNEHRTGLTWAFLVQALAKRQEG